jgi:hypothetical protein
MFIIFTDEARDYNPKGLRANLEYIPEKKNDNELDSNLNSEENFSERKLWIPIIDNKNEFVQPKGEKDSSFKLRPKKSILKVRDSPRKDDFRRISKKNFSFKEHPLNLENIRRRSTKKQSSMQNFINYLTKKRPSRILPEKPGRIYRF